MSKNACDFLSILAPFGFLVSIASAQTTPHIAVFKQVACVQPGGVCDAFGANASTENKVANGVSGDATCPSFCYRITVINDGDVDLQNISVTDATLNIASCSFPTTLAIGQSVTCTVTGVTLCQDTSNTVVAEGQSVADGSTAGHVSSMDSAAVTVVPISGACSLALSSNSALNGSTPTHLILPTGSGNTVVSVAVTLDNLSDIDQDVTVTGLIDCDMQQPVTLTTSVAAHQDATVNACVLGTCDAGTTVTVTAVGAAVATGDFTCVNDATGAPVTTTLSCTADVVCEEPVADLAISKAVVSGQAKPGQLLVYTIGVTNAGPSSADSVVVNDAVPQGTTFYSASPPPSSAPPKGAGGTVVWSEGNLDSGASGTLTLTVKVSLRGNSLIVNTATVSSSTEDPNPANNTATVTSKRKTK